MAVKKAIVITNGQLEQLQAGDRLDLGNIATKTNNSGGNMVIGNVVYISGVNALLARANAQGTIRVAGLVVSSLVADGNPVDILTDGILTATTAEWDVITGQVGGLTVGDYFLSAATAGMLTTVAPTTAGEFVLRVGHALSATEFEIEVQQPIKL